MLENVFIINNSDFFFSFRKSIHIHCGIYILDSDVYPPHLPYCTSLQERLRGPGHRPEHPIMVISNPGNFSPRKPLVLPS